MLNRSSNYYNYYYHYLDRKYYIRKLTPQNEKKPIHERDFVQQLTEEEPKVGPIKSGKSGKRWGPHGRNFFPALPKRGEAVLCNSNTLINHHHSVAIIR